MFSIPTVCTVHSVQVNSSPCMIITSVRICMQQRIVKYAFYLSKYAKKYAKTFFYFFITFNIFLRKNQKLIIETETSNYVLLLLFFIRLITNKPN